MRYKMLEFLSHDELLTGDSLCVYGPTPVARIEKLVRSSNSTHVLYRRFSNKGFTIEVDTFTEGDFFTVKRKIN